MGVNRILCCVIEIHNLNIAESYSYNSTVFGAAGMVNHSGMSAVTGTCRNSLMSLSEVMVKSVFLI